MSKGDHSRAWAFKLPQSKYAERIDAIDWSQPTDEPGSRRICIDCKGSKPEGKWCHNCDRDTASERVYA